MLKNYPKLESPFVREGEPFLVTNKIAEGMEWVFEDGVFAVDKLDGTNIAVEIKDRKVIRVQNRLNSKPLLNVKASKWDGAMLAGLNNAIQKGWLKNLEDGVHYGELVGPLFNGNRHELKEHFWVPFEYLKTRCHWKSWHENKYPKNFDSVSEWFKELNSLFTRRMTDLVKPAEGLVFYHPSGKKAKLRRDMFGWFTGRRHNS